eukprot:CAMPEP_0175040928 /NCGR_PEP_ID=MMETSP0052_2-20121109/1587_1 /TAXON_ID=51329 ORGANISM="Polytomella parva, Strain SAG 63-3" /NCGR_SAMPLE_ID=MMETSP0052_2 /ASSEMBLY_ACC=CAM_ASM_000194 /LENGTH=58 /DNA_ID=CAMNT_0016303297 /DNA_START=148 /DNA_END=321 /DNA_ORIENTATION=-
MDCKFGDAEDENGSKLARGKALLDSEIQDPLFGSESKDEEPTILDPMRSKNNECVVGW